MWNQSLSLINFDTLKWTQVQADLLKLYLKEGGPVCCYLLIRRDESLAKSENSEFTGVGKIAQNVPLVQGVAGGEWRDGGRTKLNQI